MRCIMEDNCIFCKIIAGEIPSCKVYEDEHFLAFMDINPAVLGHTLVIPKFHCRNLLDTPDNVGEGFYPVLKKVALAIKAAFNAEGIYMFQQNEPASGQEVFHSHVHIIPRYTNDEFGKHMPARLKVEIPEIASDAEKIKKYI